MRLSIATVSTPAKALSQLRVVSATVRSGELGADRIQDRQLALNGMATGAGSKLTSRNVQTCNHVAHNAPVELVACNAAQLGKNSLAI